MLLDKQGSVVQIAFDYLEKTKMEYTKGMKSPHLMKVNS